MTREASIEAIRKRRRPWDIAVIGGGATGLGVALDAASRNLSVLLLERYDFAKGTSSRSTKLVHGGVRYLQQGNIALVFEALKERGIMKSNAPHLVKDLSFVIPTYEWWDRPFYSVGLKIYDMLAGKLGLGSSQSLSKEETIAAIPTVEQEGLKGGVAFHDGQFDDARMAISLALTATDYGAVLANYVKVTGIIKNGIVAEGVKAVDMETGEDFTISARVVINATGVFTDEILKMDDPTARVSIRPSQGVHLIVDKDFLPGEYAFLLPQTSDGRILFAVPWHRKVILGTTDTPVEDISAEPLALRKEIDFILENAARYLAKKPGLSDVKSVFTGLRPLVLRQGSQKSTREISRSHKITVSDSGLISVIGGKWTTYRKMAEEAVDYAIMVGDMAKRECITEHLLIRGYVKKTNFSDPLYVYGNDARLVQEIENEKTEWGGWLSETLQIRRSQVIWAAREEMARTVEDVLARRTRALFLDAQESINIATETARLLAEVLKKSENWIAEQVKDFQDLAKKYRV